MQGKVGEYIQGMRIRGGWSERLQAPKLYWSLGKCSLYVFYYGDCN
jgi:hypothetical protein